MDASTFVLDRPWPGDRARHPAVPASLGFRPAAWLARAAAALARAYRLRRDRP
jgi:hypothetical protein